jgi:hypothetical protein
MMVLIPAEDYEELQRDRRDALAGAARGGPVRGGIAVAGAGRAHPRSAPPPGRAGGKAVGRVRIVLGGPVEES